MVGVSEGSGVSVAGNGVLDGVTAFAVDVRIADQVLAAIVSGAPGTSAIFVVVEVSVQATNTHKVTNDRKANCLCCLFMDPPDPYIAFSPSIDKNLPNCKR